MFFNSVNEIKRLRKEIHCVKSVRIRSFSGQYFSAFMLNTGRYSVSLRIESECEKIQARKTPNMDTFHAVIDTFLRKGMSNIHLKVTIEKKRRTQNFDFISLKSSSPGQFLGSSNSGRYH